METAVWLYHQEARVLIFSKSRAATGTATPYHSLDRFRMYADGENANIEKLNHLFSLRRKEICKITACYFFLSLLLTSGTSANFTALF